MKVLHIFNEINFSGAEIMYADAALTMQKQGIEMIAFSTGKKVGNYIAQFEKANIRIYHKQIDFRTLSIKSCRYYKELYNFLKQENISVVHIHRSDIYITSLIAKLARIRCVKTQHNAFRNRWFTLPYQRFVRLVERKLFSTKFHSIGQSVYLNELDYYKNPSIKINNWFDEKKFFPVSNKQEGLNIRTELNIDANTFVIVSMGSCSTIKNHSDIIRAMHLLKGKMKCTYVHLGHGSTEPDEIKLAEELGVSESIIFLGNKVNVRDYLIASDLYIMPSQFEGLGNAALEAMACGLPSILYNVPGLCDLIDNNDNGFLIANDFNILAEKIMLLRQDPQLAKKMADNAFQFVHNNFSMSLNVPKITEMYKNNCVL